MLLNRYDITMLMRTILALFLIAKYTSTTWVLAQDIAITCTSTLTIPVFKYLTHSPNITTAAVSSSSSDTLTTTIRSLSTTIEGPHQTYTLDPSPSPTTPTAPTETTLLTEIGRTVHFTTTHPSWIVPATTSLLCYDFVVMAAFAWCWVMGWFWWLKKIETRDVQRERDMGALRRRAIIHEDVERELRRLGMV
jgi:hypothetical protein